MATELVGSVDVSRGFKARQDGSLFGMAKRAFTATKQSFPGMELPRCELTLTLTLTLNPNPYQVGVRLPVHLRRATGGQLTVRRVLRDALRRT